MVRFRVVMGHEFRHRTPQRCLPDKNHPIQAFLFDRTYEALRVCIALRRQLQVVMNIKQPFSP